MPLELLVPLVALGLLQVAPAPAPAPAPADLQRTSASLFDLKWAIYNFNERERANLSPKGCISFENRLIASM